MKSWKLSENATEEERFKLQVLAREQIKLKLLNDIRFDIEVCKIEGWEYKEFLKDLHSLISEFLR